MAFLVLYSANTINLVFLCLIWAELGSCCAFLQKHTLLPLFSLWILQPCRSFLIAQLPFTYFPWAVLTVTPSAQCTAHTDVQSYQTLWWLFWLHQELNEAKMAGHTCEGFLINEIIWRGEDPRLIQTFEVGRHTFTRSFTVERSASNRCHTFCLLVLRF